MGDRTEIEAQIAALQASLESENAPEDFEIELWTGDGNGARVPYSKGRKWLQDNFGIDLDPPADPESGNNNGPDGNGDKVPPKGKAPAPRSNTAGKYFGKRSAPGK
jgi:hypothetical protein